MPPSEEQTDREIDAAIEALLGRPTGARLLRILRDSAGRHDLKFMLLLAYKAGFDRARALAFPREETLVSLIAEIGAAVAQADAAGQPREPDPERAHVPVALAQEALRRIISPPGGERDPEQIRRQAVHLAATVARFVRDACGERQEGAAHAPG
jgi:hypothetical protein